MESCQPLIADTLESGRWAFPNFDTQLVAPKNKNAAGILRKFSGLDLLNKLWPRLAIISCWDSAGSGEWAQQIRQKHPKAFLQGKGLWTTEGVVTIPFQGQYPVAITSHFFEWMDLESHKIFPTWELREGQVVQPLLSASNGLLRYRINDSVKVTGFVNRTPSMEFQGRIS